MWQELIVALIVIAAVLQACRKFLPAALRQRMVYALARKGFDQDRLAKLFRVQSDCGSGCGSCGSCETTPAPIDTSSDGGTKRRVIMLEVQR
ncbi:DUF6587 family protein [Pseudoduganella umbonata]|uniref:Uncharacterized protein n=1 Tax=Pseudoduganella umbonata TaxID=864828 RepID=A0A4P8HUM0_9BURK|nr:DUF6587 family protein [Pseudoduganella umbonata]MBB3220314.1 hypothetical protein [Pseudoduganella umbonata]QCP12145.1 hypothetical protein FCL38_18260 [Pseudoduganella umbonata]